MERRIYGLESEYGVTCTLRGQRRLTPDEVARYDAWSATWWDARGPMRPLHVTQALRGRWVREAAERMLAARFNRPGTVVGNWAWRLRREQLTPALAAEYRALIALFGRLA